MTPEQVAASYDQIADQWVDVSTYGFAQIERAVAFVKQLRRQLRRPLIVVWDRGQVHRSAAKRLATSHAKSIVFEWLPAYAPELNPVESRGSHTKYGQLANFVPDDAPQLKRSVRSALKQLHEHQLKRSFFKSARLNL